MAKQKEDYVVLVTGAAGFLGQHMVGLLQTQAGHVTEIRVLDLVPYINKTDYVATKPVRNFIGSILDTKLVEEACTGVTCVFHLASLIDVSLFPDEKKSYKVNVEGTRILLEACRNTDVERFLYCSSAAVVFGNESIFDGIEENTRYAKEHMFPVYGKTKILAEELVLAANNASLTTVSLRPMTIYGDYDWKNLTLMFGNAFTKSTGYYVKMVMTFEMGDYVYAGNVAGAFVQVENALRTDPTNQAAGTAFFIKDDTPRKEYMTFLDPILDECNLKPFPLSPPAWLILLFLQLLFPILKLVKRVYNNVNCLLGEWAFHICKSTILVSDVKARRAFGYKPVFDQAQTKRRMVKFIKSL